MQAPTISTMPIHKLYVSFYLKRRRSNSAWSSGVMDQTTAMTPTLIWAKVAVHMHMLTKLTFENKISEHKVKPRILIHFTLPFFTKFHGTQHGPPFLHCWKLWYICYVKQTIKLPLNQ